MNLQPDQQDMLISTNSKYLKNMDLSNLTSV